MHPKLAINNRDDLTQLLLNPFPNFTSNVRQVQKYVQLEIDYLAILT